MEDASVSTGGDRRRDGDHDLLLARGGGRDARPVDRLASSRSLPAEKESVLRVIDRLGSLQFDPLEVAGRNNDLVLLTRVRAYRREWTDHWLYEDRRLYETYNKSLNIVPIEELPHHRVSWDRHAPAYQDGILREHARQRLAQVARTVERRDHHRPDRARDVDRDRFDGGAVAHGLHHRCQAQRAHSRRPTESPTPPARRQS